MIDIDFIKKEIEKYNVQYWDCRYSKLEQTGILFWNKELKQIGQGDFEGVGVRILIGDGWGFSASTKVDNGSLRELIKNAVKISKLLNKGKEKIKMENIKSIKDKKQIKGKREIGEISLEEKKNFLQEQNYELKDPIKSIYLRYRDIKEKRFFISSSSEIHQEIDSIYLVGGVSAFESGKSEEKQFRVAGLGGFENLKNSQQELDKTILGAKKFLKASSIKKGKYDLVLSGDLTGLFVHEALGHASEADFILKGNSCLKGLLGKKLAGENINILDDPTQENFRGFGSYYYDDEGVSSRKNYILKNGKLNSYLHTLETSKKLNTAPTGNARAENSLVKPIVRMSNTYMEKGDYNFNDLLEEIKEGYFLKGFKGGQTNPADGGFQFGAADAYYVKNGKIIEPVRGGGIGGHTLNFLRKIKFVEDKYSEESLGFCGKSGQVVLTGGRNPAVFVKEALLI